ncbi:MAG TPA: hypothetical protein VF135_09535 [Terriglobales bacterium]
MSRSPDDFADVITGAAVDSPGFQSILPHFLVGNSMRTDEADSIEFVRQAADFRQFGQFEIEHNYVSAMPVDDVSYLVEVTCNAYVSEIRVELRCKMLSHDAVGLSDNHVVVVHDSLTMRRPGGG